MAGDWIPMRHGLTSDPDVLLIAHRLGVSAYEAVGLLHHFWSWCSENSVDGDLSRLQRDILVTVFAHPSLLDALEEVGWVSKKGSGYRVEHFDRWLSSGAKARLQAARRQKARREGADSCHARVTKMSRSERDKSVTTEQKRRVHTNTPPRVPPKGGRPLWSGELPEGLRGEEFRGAWEEWLAFRRLELRKPVTQRSGDMALREILEWGPERGVQAIRHTIAKGWQGLREPEVRRGGPGDAGFDPVAYAKQLEDERNGRP